jgi:uncharacterized protein YecE (DUF72 family)
MELRAGTSGYSYKEWKGPFYPEKLAAREMLRFYAERLPAVEINNTFYRLPKASVLESWAEQVPPDFRFAVKASRRITHFKRLVDAGDETAYLLDTLRTLGERLGVVLFQLPPNLRADRDRLESFLSLLPEGTPAAFEFRHESWLEEPLLAPLRDRGFALVAVDAVDAVDAGEDSADAAPIATADWGYLRLRAPGYERAELARWAGRIDAQPWQRAFVFFKHEDAGAGPRMAAEFLEVAARRGERKPPASAPQAARRRETA